MENLTAWIAQLDEWRTQLAFKFITTVLIILVSVAIYYLILKFIYPLKDEENQKDYLQQRKYLKQNLRNVIFFIGSILIAYIWLANHLLELAVFIEKLIGISPDIQRKIIKSILTIIFLVIVRKGALRLFFQLNTDVKRNYRTRNIITYTIFTLGTILVGRIWFAGLDSIATYFGLLSAGIAIALKEPIVNLAGWLFIMFRRPFELGDRVEIGGHSGDVIDINIFQFTLNEIGNWVDADQSTGRIIHIPNARVFAETQANYTRGFNFIWNEIPVLVTFESDWQKAKEILQDIADDYSIGTQQIAEYHLKKATEKYLIYYSKLTPKVYTDVKDSGVMLTIRYLCTPPQRRDSKEKIWEEILLKFAPHNDIDFAYPTTRRYDNQFEGKGKTPNVPPSSKQD